jgi:hypothetical protein
MRGWACVERSGFVAFNERGKLMKLVSVSALCGSVFVGLGLSAGAAKAALVQLNASTPAVIANSTVALTRYRVSNTNWDQIVAVSPNISGNTIVAQQNLGNADTLNNRAWDFSVSYVAGSGYTYMLTDTTLPPLSPSTLVWTAPGGSPAVSPTRSFNAIQLYATAQPVSGTTGTLPTSIDVRNLVFSGAGLSTSGALATMNDTDATSPGGVNQWLVADTDLSLFNWVLTGQVQASFLGSITAANQADERLKLDVSMQSVAAVPVPAALPLFVSGLIGFGIFASRRGERLQPASRRPAATAA